MGVVSRSNEAKAMGIKMGEPYFKLKHRVGTQTAIVNLQIMHYMPICHSV